MLLNARYCHFAADRLPVSLLSLAASTFAATTAQMQITPQIINTLVFTFLDCSIFVISFQCRFVRLLHRFVEFISISGNSRNSLHGFLVEYQNHECLFIDNANGRDVLRSFKSYASHTWFPAERMSVLLHDGGASPTLLFHIFPGEGSAISSSQTLSRQRRFGRSKKRYSTVFAGIGCRPVFRR